jgi:hypothetical protein
VDTSKTNGKTVHWADRLRARPVEVKDDAVNNRFSSRKRSDMPAVIYSDKMPNAVRCMVRDTSSTGAQIHLLPSAERLTVDDLPETFTLIMTHYKERSDVQCQIVRRFGDRVGVRFMSSFVMREVATRPMARAKK